jgi:hypothetical protein
MMRAGGKALKIASLGLAKLCQTLKTSALRQNKSTMAQKDLFFTKTIFFIEKQICNGANPTEKAKSKLFFDKDNRLFASLLIIFWLFRFF